MKAKKISIIVLFIFFSARVLYAQEYKLAVQNSKETRLILKDFNGVLPIEGYNGNEIVITSTAGKMVPPEKAKGLKPIFPAGTDNTGIGLEVQKIDNLITITCIIPFKQDGDYKLKIPENLALELSSGCERKNDIQIKNMKNEIEIKSCHNIDLKEVSGPLVLSTISGDINITYGDINSTKSSSVNSISGDIDITLPVKTATNLELGTISGAIYSDFDFSESRKNLKRIGGSVSDFSLNGGGFKFSIRSINGNIYLRKGN
jgi:lia operon protein LiaG